VKEGGNMARAPKYLYPLKDYLLMKNEAIVQISIAELQKLIGRTLPAYEAQEPFTFWNSTGSPWEEAGYEILAPNDTQKSGFYTFKQRLIK
jgi:hypothetical protein